MFTRNSKQEITQLEETGHDSIFFLIWCHLIWLVSTYVVCERLSVMHEPAGVVENLVQILQFTPILQYRIPPPPPELKIVRNLGTLTFQLQNTPPPPKIET